MSQLSDDDDWRQHPLSNPSSNGSSPSKIAAAANASNSIPNNQTVGLRFKKYLASRTANSQLGQRAIKHYLGPVS
jgi:hypothetical protein